MSKRFYPRIYTKSDLVHRKPRTPLSLKEILHTEWDYCYIERAVKKIKEESPQLTPDSPEFLPRLRQLLAKDLESLQSDAVETEEAIKEVKIVLGDLDFQLKPKTK